MQPSDLDWDVWRNGFKKGSQAGPPLVVYALFREFSALASPHGPLFGGCAHGHHIPQHVAAGRTLAHAKGARLSADGLLQAFEPIRRAPQRDIRPWNMPRQGPQGRRKVMAHGGHRLRLSGLPGVAQPLRPSPPLALDIRRVKRARIGPESLLTLLVGLTTRRRWRPPPPRSSPAPRAREPSEFCACGRASADAAPHTDGGTAPCRAPGSRH